MPAANSSGPGGLPAYTGARRREGGKLGILPGRRVAAFDWAIAGAGPCTIDVGWYLAVNATRLTGAKEQVLDRYGSLLEEARGQPVPEPLWRRLRGGRGRLRRAHAALVESAGARRRTARRRRRVGLVGGSAGTMRRLRYNVAVSLDGFIARPNGAYSSIVEDNTIDFSALMREFDALVMGRRTYDVVRTQGSANPFGRNRLVVASRTLNPADYPGVTVIASNVDAYVAAMKREPGKDIWLFGGGDLFHQAVLREPGRHDRARPDADPDRRRHPRALPAGPDSPKLELTSSKPLPSGIVLLTSRVPEQKAGSG